MKPTRRNLLLASAGITSLTGCVGVLSENDTETPTEVPSDEKPITGTKKVTIDHVEKTFELGPGGFEPFQIEFDADTPWLEYSVFVRDSGPVDALMMNSKNYERYLDDDSFEIYTVWSMKNVVQDDITFPIEETDWILVIDHTDAATEPNGSPVTIDFGLEIYKFVPSRG